MYGFQNSTMVSHMNFQKSDQLLPLCQTIHPINKEDQSQCHNFTDTQQLLTTKEIYLFLIIIISKTLLLNLNIHKNGLKQLNILQTVDSSQLVLTMTQSIFIKYLQMENILFITRLNICILQPSQLLTGVKIQNI